MTRKGEKYSINKGSVLRLALTCLTLLATARGQAPPAAQTGSGLVSYAQFTGSANTLGRIFELDSSVGYNFNEHLGMDIGIPLYFVQPSASTGGASESGVGNLALDGRVKFLNPTVNFGSVLTMTAPTGDPSKGLSTGRVTVDWSNRVDRTFGRLTPFAELGISNTVADSQYFLRPYTSLGFNTHLRAGSSFALGKVFSVGAAGYDIIPSGQQTIFSRVVGGGAAASATVSGQGRAFASGHEIAGAASIAHDDGFSGWVDASPSPYLTFELAYTRSVPFALNTVSFGVGVNIGSLVRQQPHP